MKTSDSEQRSTPGPHDVVRVQLNNGLVVLVRENHASPVAVLEGALPAGAVHNTREKAGLASFVASMLMRGGERYDFDVFNERIEGVGANLSVSAGLHSTDFGSTSLSEDFPMMVDLLADIMRRPVFPAEHIGRVRNRILVHIQESEQDTAQLAHLRFFETVYADHPYGFSQTGYVDSIAGVSRDDLAGFHAAHYTPQGAVIVVAGDVESQRVIDIIEAAFGDWTGPSPVQTVAPVTASRGGKRLDFPLRDKVQSDLVIGCPALSRQHPDFHPARVANTILGHFGMMGRLGERVREEQGLAYYADSSLDATPHAGVWLASAGVNPYNVDVAIVSILTEFGRLGLERVTDEELADSQAYMTGIVPLTLETNEGVAATLLQMEWHNLGLDYLQRYRDIVYGVTAEDVQRVAAAYLNPKECITIVAGPSID